MIKRLPAALPPASSRNGSLPRVRRDTFGRLSNSERGVLRVFRQFRVTPGQMLCFCGPQLKRYSSALRTLTDNRLLIKEQFKGGYSLTNAGFAAMLAAQAQG